MKRRIFNFVLVIFSMLTIFLFSSETATNSTNTSKSVAKEIISIIIKDEAKVDKIINNNFVVIRKLAHITEFFLLGFLITNILVDGKNNISYKYIIIAVLLAALYAVTDELHQNLILGRAGRILDVGIDTIGSFLGSFSYYLLYKNAKKKV